MKPGAGAAIFGKGCGDEGPPMAGRWCEEEEEGGAGGGSAGPERGGREASPVGLFLGTPGTAEDCRWWSSLPRLWNTSPR